MGNYYEISELSKGNGKKQVWRENPDNLRHILTARNFEFFFGKGTFDNFCVYIRNENSKGKYRVPLDCEYFQTLINFKAKYGGEMLFKTFSKVYDIVSKEINDENAVDKIERICEEYRGDSEDRRQMVLLMTTLYMGMIAEENKKGAKLGKMMKKLGVYQILILNKTAEYASEFSKGKKAYELKAICHEYGF